MLAAVHPSSAAEWPSLDALLSASGSCGGFFRLSPRSANRAQQGLSLLGCGRPALVKTGAVEFKQLLFQLFAQPFPRKGLNVLRAADSTMRRNLNKYVHTPSRKCGPPSRANLP
jgi:hypothetical protein